MQSRDVLGADVAQRLATVDSEQLVQRLASMLDLLNVSEDMTSQAEVDLQRVMTSRLLDELARLRQNASRVSDVTQDTRTRAHNYRVSIPLTTEMMRLIIISEVHWAFKRLACKYCIIQTQQRENDRERETETQTKCSAQGTLGYGNTS